MHSLHLMQVFRVADDHIFEQCDALMDALMSMEDEHVRDAAVSADRERSLVLVEVTATGADRTAAEIAGLTRIYAALTQQVGVTVVDEVEDRRTVRELAPA